MSGLNHTLNVGAESLIASRQGVDTAGHNIANAHTEGYSRQRINLEQRHPSHSKGVVIGNGVFVKNITRAHDQFLEKQINNTHQDLGFTQSRYDAMKPIEEIYNPALNTSPSDEINNFFNAVQDLSNFPEEITVRSHLRESAESLIASFQRVDRSLKSYREDLNARIAGETQEATTLVKEISKLNIAIKSMETAGDKEVSDLLDQQDLLLRKLTEVMDINYYRGDRGMVVVRGPAETLLVDRGYHANINVRKNINNHGLYDIIVEDGSSHKEINVTDVNKRGRLAGLVDVRDHEIGNLLRHNNQMAYDFANSVNAVHRTGFGLKQYEESQGRDFFTVSDSLDLAAETLNLHDLIQGDLNAISAGSTPFAPGDNVVANQLLRLKEARIMENGDTTFNNYYTNYVGVFGLELVRADHVNKANSTLMDDLNARREAISGVSMDEEAMNLLKWQANFTASSKVITTIDEMFETILGMKR